MPKEIITIALGQCGNSIASSFWPRLCKEHGLKPNGTMGASCEETVFDRKDIFFYQADDNKFIPRSILIDLESKVIDGIKNCEYGSLYNSENMWTSIEERGAGNNWANGYSQADSVSEKIFEIINREVDNCDNLEGFVLTHSIAGGTGSGMGSWLLEQLRDRFPTKLIQTYSIFAQKESGVVVEPYNSILSLKRLALYADSVVLLDNVALHNIVSSQNQSSDFTEINDLVSMVMSAATNPLRFPGYSHSSLSEMIMPLVPSPRLHFLMAAFTPLSFADHSMPTSIKKTSVFDVMSRLIQPKNLMVEAPLHKGKYISFMNVLQGELEYGEIHKSLQKLRQKQLDDSFITWGPAGPQVVVGNVSPNLKSEHRVSGLLLANHSSMHAVLGACMKRFDSLFKVGAFVENYRNFGTMFVENLAEFDDSREVVNSVIEEYKAVQNPDYVDFGQSQSLQNLKY